MSNSEYREAQQQADDLCKCGQETNICAPWLYMGAVARRALLAVRSDATSRGSAVR